VEKTLLLLPLLLAVADPPVAKDPMLAKFLDRLAVIEKTEIGDKRLEFFEVQATERNRRWDVTGETTLTSARDAVLEAARETFGARLGSVDIKLLPDPALGQNNEALVRVSVAPLRRVPRHSAEMVDQVVMGTPLRLLKTEGSWFLVQTPYRYLGWIENSLIMRVTPTERAAWAAGSLARYSKPFGTIWSQPDRSEPVSDIVLSCMVQTGASRDGLTAVKLPDGRSGFVPEDSLLPSELTGYEKPRGAEIVRLALQLRGIPYLWGGNSSKGFDCSGFTQTVFRMNGIQLPRDADQQSRVGERVEPVPDFSNLKPGDLLFFGKERITHVAISLGGAHFIHASGDVHISSLSAQDEQYDAGRRSTLQFVKRLPVE